MGCFHGAFLFFLRSAFVQPALGLIRRRRDWLLSLVRSRIKARGRRVDDGSLMAYHPPNLEPRHTPTLSRPTQIISAIQPKDPTEADISESPKRTSNSQDPYSDDDDLDPDAEGVEGRSTSPSKLTARQRAKGNKDLQETLVSLPGKSFPWVFFFIFSFQM